MLSDSEIALANQLTTFKLFESVDAYKKILSAHSTEEINNALLAPQKNGLSVLTYVFLLKDPEKFAALLNKVSSEGFNKALLIKDQDTRRGYGNNVLDVAFGQHRTFFTSEPYYRTAVKNFCAMIEMASESTLNTMFDDINYSGWVLAELIVRSRLCREFVPLHKAKRDVLDKTFNALINKLTPQNIGKELRYTKSYGGVSVISMCACAFNSATFKALVEKAPEAELNQSLCFAQGLSFETHGAFFWAIVRGYKDDAIKILIDKTTHETFDKILTVDLQYPVNLLDLLVEKLNSANCVELIHKTSSHVLNQAMHFPHHRNGKSVIGIAIERQDKVTSKALIDIATNESITQSVLMKKGDAGRLLKLAASFLDIQTFNKLIIKSSEALPEAMKQMLSMDKNLDKTVGWVEAQLSFVSNDTELEPWILMLLEISRQFNAWPDGKFFTDKVTLLEQLPRIITNDFSTGIASAIIQRINNQEFPLQRGLNSLSRLMLTSVDGQTTPLDVTIQLGNADRSIVQLSDDDIQQTILTHGLASWKDFYILQKSKIETLSHFLDMMIRYDTLQPATMQPLLIDINNELQNGNLLMKVFSGWQPDAWLQYIEQLKNPQIRAALRKPLDKKVSEYKFVHLSGEIILYVPTSEEEKSKRIYTHAKKQSHTLVSSNLSTVLFQSHRNDLPLVGVVVRADPNTAADSPYDPNRAKLKALLYNDGGTYGRHWRGTLKQVTQYKEREQNYTSLDEFKKVVAKNTERHNEVLAEPSAGSLMGILMGRDRPNERKMARQFQQDIKRELGIDLPIILYDAAQRKFIEDMNLYEFIQFKKSLQEERESLLEKPSSSYSKSFFHKTAIECYEGKSYPNHVVTRLKEIDALLLEIESLNSSESKGAPAP